MNPQLHFAADLSWRAGEHIERIGHAAVGAVFQRHQAVVRLPTIDFIKHGADRAHRHQFHAMAKAVNPYGDGKAAQRILNVLHGEDVDENMFVPRETCVA